MALTKERKLLIGVLSLGLAALGVDRVLLGGGTGPAEAAADSFSAAARAAETAPAPAATDTGLAGPSSEVVTAAAVAAPRLGQRLDDLAATLDLTDGVSRDAFTIPAEWRAELEPKPDKGSAPEPSAQDLVAPFAERHRLMAVIAEGRSGAAIVDGQPIRLGETLEGARLVELRKRSAIFERGGEHLELRLRVGGR